MKCISCLESLRVNLEEMGLVEQDEEGGRMITKELRSLLCTAQAKHDSMVGMKSSTVDGPNPAPFGTVCPSRVRLCCCTKVKGMRKTGLCSISL